MYSDWAQFSVTFMEFVSVRESLNGIPSAWIEWVERRTQRRIALGLRIHHPLQYRIASLYSGIATLQECKFIEDIFEIALRCGVVMHTKDREISLTDLATSIARGDQIQKRFSSHGTLDQLLTELDFYQTTELIARNWKRLGPAGGRNTGFATLFWRSRKCRDVNAFRRDASKVRRLRNIAAHSKQLVTSNEIASVYHVAERWLAPLGVDLGTRVTQYRSRRPNFLCELERVLPLEAQSRRSV